MVREVAQRGRNLRFLSLWKLFLPFRHSQLLTDLTPPVARPMILLRSIQEATDGVIRKAVRQPARFGIPML